MRRLFDACDNLTGFAYLESCEVRERLEHASQQLRATRPTAVNLRVGLLLRWLPDAIVSQCQVTMKVLRRLRKLWKALAAWTNVVSIANFEGCMQTL